MKKKKLESMNITMLRCKEMKNINGGAVGIGTAIAIGIVGSAIYETGKHFIAGLFSPFDSNEN